MTSFYGKLEQKSKLYENCLKNLKQNVRYDLTSFLADKKKKILIAQWSIPFQGVDIILNCFNTLGETLKSQYVPNMPFTWEQWLDALSGASKILGKLPKLMIIDYNSPKVSPKDIKVLTTLMDRITADENDHKIIIVISPCAINFETFLETISHELYMRIDYFGPEINMACTEKKPKANSLPEAALLGLLEEVKYFINSGDDINSYEFGYNALLNASSKGHHEVVLHLLNNGADPNRHRFNRQQHLTSLYLAVSNGHLETVEILLKRKAIVDLACSFGNTPLHAASLNGHIEIGILLIEYEAELETENSSGETPLSLACANGHSGMAEILLDYGAKVDSINSEEESPLHLAAAKGSMETVKVLMKHGANRNLKSKRNQTASEKASEKKFEDIAAYINNYSTTQECCQ